MGPELYDDGAAVVWAETQVFAGRAVVAKRIEIQNGDVFIGAP
jgi:hypothetical protein